jgi:hypothetical protein
MGLGLRGRGIKYATAHTNTTSIVCAAIKTAIGKRRCADILHCSTQIIVYYQDGNEVGTKNGRLRFQQGRAGDVFGLMLVTGLLGLVENQ